MNYLPRDEQMAPDLRLVMNYWSTERSFVKIDKEEKNGRLVCWSGHFARKYPGIRYRYSIIHTKEGNET